MTDRPSLIPSAKALELVRGAYDLHVHSGPDVVTRLANDLDISRAFKSRHMAGYVIKSHYTPSAGRAALARAAVPGVDVIGALTLNAAVGGLNALAVEVAVREGARIVWLPTVDAENQMAGKMPSRQSKTIETKPSHQARGDGVMNAPVRVVDEGGHVLPEAREVLETIARHDLVLATGHLSRDEIVSVVAEAWRVGVTRIIVTHPDSPSQRLSVEDQRTLAARGAYLERCFLTPHTGKVSWKIIIAAIRAVGPEHSVLSSDLGQLANPPVEDGLPLWVDRLLEAGFSEGEVHQMAVENPFRLVRGSVR